MAENTGDNAFKATPRATPAASMPARNNDAEASVPTAAARLNHTSFGVKVSAGRTAATYAVNKMAATGKRIIFIATGSKSRRP